MSLPKVRYTWQEMSGIQNGIPADVVHLRRMRYMAHVAAADQKAAVGPKNEEEPVVDAKLDEILRRINAFEMDARIAAQISQETEVDAPKPAIVERLI